MASADLRSIMRFSCRRGPRNVWFDGQRDGRRFAIFQGADGDWTLFERVGHPDVVEDGETGARSEARPTRPSRPAPRRMRRELVRLGLVEAGDAIVEGGR